MEEYLASSRLRDVIEDNNLLILVISRFDIPFGFGDASVAEVCRKHGVDTQTFLAIANLIGNHLRAATPVSLPSLMKYLKKAHTYFLDFNLPLIRRKLIEAINCSEMTDVTFLILKYYDDYVMEVRRHMGYENEVVFPYIERLISHGERGDFYIAEYSANHTDMTERLSELIDIVIHHYQHGGNDMLNSVLYDLISCQKDLETHCRVENEILVPAATRLESSISDEEATDEPVADEPQDAVPPIDAIGEREKEVIRYVAKGLQNKEIADAMCLSVHTITTYRRNIAAKLNIHSPAGLTIFAIIHHLIDIREIRLQ